jgi:putative transposase
MRERFGLTKSRSCRLTGLSRSAVYYQPRGQPEEAALRTRMRALAEGHRSWGLPMIHLILRREKLVVNHKRSERVYRELGLSLTIRKHKKRAAATRLELPKASRPNERWSMDFMQDVLWNGRRVRVLTIIDTFTRECPIIEVDTSLTGERVSRVLDWLALTRGVPDSITVDNGPEFAGKAMDQWAYQHGVKLDFIRPGKPTENGYIESFNGTVRRECLKQHYFTSLDEAKRLIEDWRVEYNQFRPHSSIEGLTPEAFASQWRQSTEANTQTLYSLPV